MALEKNEKKDAASVQSREKNYIKSNFSRPWSLRRTIRRIKEVCDRVRMITRKRGLARRRHVWAWRSPSWKTCYRMHEFQWNMFTIQQQKLTRWMTMLHGRQITVTRSYNDVYNKFLWPDTEKKKNKKNKKTNNNIIFLIHFTVLNLNKITRAILW